MKYGLFTCPYQRLSLEKAFSDASVMGYDYVELWGGRPHAYAPDLLDGDLDAVLRLIDRFEMPVEVYTPEHNAYPYNYMIGTERQWEDAMDYLSAALCCGRALGAKHTLISVGHSGFAPLQERRARLLKSLRHLSSEAERLDHPLLLEPLTPMESDFCTCAEELLDILEELNSPFIQGMCDVVVPFVQHRNPADDIRLLGSRMAHLHLTDSDGITETHLLPGDGAMDLRGLLGELKTGIYDGSTTLELVTHYIDTPSEAAFAAIRRIREMTEDENSLCR